MKALLLLVLSCSTVLAADPANMSADERFNYYEKAGLGYAKLLYQDPKSEEEENRATKTELLNIKIRSKTIDSTKALLAKTSDQNLRRELIQRLAVLENEQAETFGHLNNRKADQDASLRRSIDYYSKLLHDFPGWRTDISLFRSAEAQDKLGKSDEAMKLYQRIIKDFPKSTVRADSLLALGNIYFDRKAFGIAENTYKQILATPEETLHAYAHYKMAWCHFNVSDFNPAISELEASIKESRKLQAGGDHRLGVEDEALSDLVLFFAEYGNPLEAKAYFEKIAPKEKAKSMRFDLARRLFDYGKHLMARNVASELLADNPSDEYTHKLYLILISVAERLQDRNLGLETAKRLTAWLGSHKVEDVVHADSEEYLRLYAEKLHHEAETIKKKELWAYAKSGYEIYLAAFPKEKETPEMQFRYAVLLMSIKQPLQAYNSISAALTSMTNKHPRYKESLHLRIQAIEFCSKDDRQSISDKNIVLAYDEFAKYDPKDPLASEAAYKAADIAKSFETPELVSKRYQDIANTWPNLALAKNAARQSLAVLINANKWDVLKQTTELMHASTSDSEFSEKIREAHELAQLKIIEDLEKKGKITEAKKALEAILQTKRSEVMGIYALTRLATLAEKDSAKQAIPFLDRIQKEYPNSKEAKNALLNMARLNTKIMQPKLAVENYLSFAGNGNGEVENQARMNAAIILEAMGSHAKAGALFAQVSESLKHQKSAAQDSTKAFEASCNNYLIAAGDSKQQEILKKLAECSNELASSGSIKWEARAAWANEQGGKSARWEKIAHHKIKELKDEDKFYVAMAKIHLLEVKIEEFKSLKFAKTNEKPMANITKKSDAMDIIEKLAAAILEIASQKQALVTQRDLRNAYLDFAETMSGAALPTHVSEAERSELKKTFLSVAADFETKAKALAPVEARKSASIASAAEGTAKIPSLDSKDDDAIAAGTASPDLLGKLAYSRYQRGEYGEARYFSMEWQKSLAASKASEPIFNEDGLEKFRQLLSTKLVERDPVSDEF